MGAPVVVKVEGNISRSETVEMIMENSVGLKPTWVYFVSQKQPAL